MKSDVGGLKYELYGVWDILSLRVKLLNYALKI